MSLSPARVTLDFDGSVQSTKRHAEGTAVGYNLLRELQMQTRAPSRRTTAMPTLPTGRQAAGRPSGLVSGSLRESTRFVRPCSSGPDASPGPMAG